MLYECTAKNYRKQAQAEVVAGNEVCGGKVQQYQLIVHLHFVGDYI